MKPKTEQPEFRMVDGILFPTDKTDLEIQLLLFLYSPKFLDATKQIVVHGRECFYTGQGRFSHLKLVSQILFKKSFEWHRWSTRLSQQACEEEWLFVTGCGASSKSTSLGGLYPFVWWLAAPLESAVIIASKTIDSAKKRAWREVARFYSLFSNLMGGYRDAIITTSPRPAICPIVGMDRKKDEAHGLFVTALHGKELDKEIGYIKGFHPKRILVIADELDVLEDGGKALIDTFTDNLRTGTWESQFIGLGNDPSLLNSLGDMMAPAPGQPLTLNHTEWRSAKNVACIRLSAYDSPNITDNNKWTGLVRQQDIDELIKRKGPNSPSAWIQLEGLHPPEGVDNTVLSENTLIRFHCFEQVTWKRDFITSASLDPGFGGDPCVLRLFQRGLDTTNTLRILCGQIIQIPIDLKSSEPAEYQIASRVIAICKANSVAPDEFVIGSTGTGRGSSAVLKRDWSPRILEVQEGGAPSDRIIDPAHPIPANEQFDRKVTELWMDIRTFVEADLIRGLDSTTATQLVSRTYEDIGGQSRRKLSLQKKEDMLHSPNESDALAFAIELFIQKGVIPTPAGPAVTQNTTDFNKATEELDFDSSELAYSDPLLDSAMFTEELPF